MTTSARLLARQTLGLAGLLALVLSLVSLAAPAQARYINPDFFGMHDGAIASGSIPGVTTGATRLWDTGTTWRQMSTPLGTTDLEPARRAVATAEAAGLRPMLVLGQTPQLHAEHPDAPGAYGPGASSMPRLPAWQLYVDTVVREFGTRVDYQIWNEPNVIEFWGGSPAQMATLTATASRTIRKVAPGATIVAPSFPLRLDAQRDWYRRYWAQRVDGKGMSSYVTVVSVNLYPAESEGPEAQLPLLRYAKHALPKAARAKPMWNTEINYGLKRGGDSARQISDGDQSAYVARTLILNAASPIRRVYWYRWDINRRIANTHLVQDDETTLTPAGKAWNRVRGWINGTDFAGCTQARRGRTKGVYTCTAHEGRREVRRIYWKPSGRSVPITTHRTTRISTPLAGNTRSRRGSFRLQVGESPVMVTSRR